MASCGNPRLFCWGAEGSEVAATVLQELLIPFWGIVEVYDKTTAMLGIWDYNIGKHSGRYKNSGKSFKSQTHYPTKPFRAQTLLLELATWGPQRPHKQKDPTKHNFWYPLTFCWALEPKGAVRMFMWSFGPL